MAVIEPNAPKLPLRKASNKRPELVIPLRRQRAGFSFTTTLNLIR
jgi:hypothetical protein